MTDLIHVNTVGMRQLANFLEKVPPEDFSLEGWRTQMPRDAWMLGPITLRRGCGFAGCAMGWAAHSNVFPGLRINRDGDLVYRGALDHDAVVKLFGIKEQTVEFLFWCTSYEDYPVTPDMVATRVRRFVEKVEARIAGKSGRAWVSTITGAAYASNTVAATVS